MSIFRDPKKNNQPVGFALGSVEGRVAIQFIEPQNPWVFFCKLKKVICCFFQVALILMSPLFLPYSTYQLRLTWINWVWISLLQSKFLFKIRPCSDYTGFYRFSCQHETILNHCSVWYELLSDMWPSTLKISAVCSFAPLQKLRQNHRSCVWTEALSGMVSVPAQMPREVGGRGGGLHRISSEREDRRIFGGFKFSISEFFG